MLHEFLQKFLEGNPQQLSLGVLFREANWPDATTLQEMVQNYAPELAEAKVEWHSLEEHPELAKLIQGDGPPASFLGLIEFGEHSVRLLASDGPMPYGPLQSCVEPAMMSPEDKQEAAAHQAHVLLYESSAAPGLERWTAITAIAGVFAWLGGSTIINEEARSAIPGPDLIPEGEENIFSTIRKLPVPYFFGGFLLMDTQEASGKWVRTFNNHSLGLPNLAMRVTSDDDTQNAFNIFSGVLGYVQATQEELIPDDTANLGEYGKIAFRVPEESQWYLESEGKLLILEKLE